MTDIIQASSEAASSANVSDNDSSQGAGTVSNTDSGLQTSERASDSDSLHMTKGDTDSQHTESDREQEGGPMRVTRKYLLDMFKKEWRQYYRTFELNEKLYLHYKGFDKLENMHLFPDLKCLYFEGNGISVISGLETNTQMMSLMLQENLIRKMEGFHTMSQLRTLNLSDNCIFKIEGLENCSLLISLYIKKNRLGSKPLNESDDNLCFNALAGLLEAPSIETLDMSNNWIADPTVVQQVFQKMPNLKVLYMLECPLIKKIKNYRKTVISELPELKYLDDRPVFVDDRRNAEAFTRGGLDEERAERDRIKAEKKVAHDKMHADFKAMMKKAKLARLADLQAQKDLTREEKAETENIHKMYISENADKADKADNEDKENSEPRVVELADDDCPPELEKVDIEAEREALKKKEAEELKKKEEWHARLEKQKAEREKQEIFSEESKDEPIELEEVQIEEMEEEEEEESPIVKEVQGLPGQEATEVKPSETVTDFDELD